MHLCTRSVGLPWVSGPPRMEGGRVRGGEGQQGQLHHGLQHGGECITAYVVGSKGSVARGHHERRMTSLFDHDFAVPSRTCYNSTAVRP